MFYRLYIPRAAGSFFVTRHASLLLRRLPRFLLPTPPAPAAHR